MGRYSYRHTKNVTSVYKLGSRETGHYSKIVNYAYY